MSAKATGYVFDANLNKTTKIILLAYADHADHDGKNIFPSIGLIAWKTGSSPNTVRRHTKLMIDAGYLIAEGESKLGTNQYRIDFKKLPKRESYIGTGRRGRPKINPPTLEGLKTNPPKSKINPPKNGSNPPIAMGTDPSFKSSLKEKKRKELKDSPSEDTRTKEESKPKQKSEHDQNMEYLESVFAQARGCDLPDWKKGNGAGLQKTWRTPVREILDKCDGDITKAEFIIRQVVKNMLEDDIRNFDKPLQIMNVARPFIIDLKGQGIDQQTSPNFSKIWAKERAEKERAEQERLRQQST